MFDDCLEDRKESYPCECGGNITKTEQGNCWTCDTCNFSKRIEVEE